MITLRPAISQDRPFLLEVYAATRADELAQAGFDAVSLHAFLVQQFEAQDAHYRRAYLGARFDVVQVDGVDAGRLYVHRSGDELRLMDIALLPAFRGFGVGTRLLGDLFDEAQAGGLAVSLHVEHSNPARALYERLGFTVAQDRGVYLSMLWTPRTEVVSWSHPR